MNDQCDAKTPLLPPTSPRWWRVLPNLILLMIVANIDNLILNDFIEYRYAKYYEVNSSSTEDSHELCLNASRTSHNSTSIKSTTTPIYPTSSTTESWNEIVQTSTARLNVFISLATTVPAIITSIVLGTNCDIIGRKPLIALPFIGKILRYLVLTPVAYYNLPDIWIIVATVFDGLFGTVALAILSAFAYVTDCTSEKSRTIAIIITDVCLSGSRFIPLMTIGFYLRHPIHPVYVQSMLIALSISIIGFLCSLFLQPESNLNVQNLNILQQLKRVQFQPIKNCLQVFFVKRHNHKQRSLLILVAIHLCLISMICGNVAMFYIYLYGTPICFDSFGASLCSTAQSLAIIVLTIAYTLANKHTDHLVVPAIGCLSLMIQFISFAIVKQIWSIYLAVCIGGLFFVLIPVIRSRITKLVEPFEYASVFILASVFESGGYYAISALTNEIYELSVLFYPGLVYFFLTSIGILALVLMLILYILEYQSTDVNKVLSLND